MTNWGPIYYSNGDTEADQGRAVVQCFSIDNATVICLNSYRKLITEGKSYSKIMIAQYVNGLGYEQEPVINR